MCGSLKAFSVRSIHHKPGEYRCDFAIRPLNQKINILLVCLQCAVHSMCSSVPAQPNNVWRNCNLPRKKFDTSMRMRKKKKKAHTNTHQPNHVKRERGHVVVRLPSLYLDLHKLICHKIFLKHQIRMAHFVVLSIPNGIIS